MVEDLISYLTLPVVQISVIMGLAEVIKYLGIDKKYIPLIDLILGLVCGVFVYEIILGHGLANSIMIGVALGLSSCGLFSGIKSFIKKGETND